IYVQQPLENGQPYLGLYTTSSAKPTTTNVCCTYCFCIPNHPKGASYRPRVQNHPPRQGI
ncbi:MAG TPA: hypothetical protein PK185_15115, partial [Cyclobacteriaceae bacterium]|nr:hypothetical protein [Cyclobacteriaceae bacterium]